MRLYLACSAGLLGEAEQGTSAGVPLHLSGCGPAFGLRSQGGGSHSTMFSLLPCACSRFCRTSLCPSMKGALGNAFELGVLEPCSHAEEQCFPEPSEEISI